MNLALKQPATQAEIAKGGAIPLLVRMLQSGNEDDVLQAAGERARAAAAGCRTRATNRSPLLSQALSASSPPAL